MSDIAAGLAVDASFAAFGKAATYTPPGGVAADCIVIRNSPDAVAPFGDGSALMQTNTIEVRKSEIAAPVKGGVFVPGAIVDGVFVPATEELEVIADPQVLDPDRLVWTCRVE